MSLKEIEKYFMELLLPHIVYRLPALFFSLRPNSTYLSSQKPSGQRLGRHQLWWACGRSQTSSRPTWDLPAVFRNEPAHDLFIFFLSRVWHGLTSTQITVNVYIHCRHEDGAIISCSTALLVTSVSASTPHINFKRHRYPRSFSTQGLSPLPLHLICIS